MADDMQLWVITEDEEPTDSRRSDDVGGTFSTGALTDKILKMTRKRVPLDAGLLKSQMSGMIQIVGDLFEQADDQGMQLAEVELTVAINADCSVSLVGTGGKIGNTGGIKLKFVRQPTD